MLPKEHGGELTLSTPLFLWLQSPVWLFPWFRAEKHKKYPPLQRRCESLRHRGQPGEDFLTHTFSRRPYYLCVFSAQLALQNTENEWVKWSSKLEHGAFLKVFFWTSEARWWWLKRHLKTKGGEAQTHKSNKSKCATFLCLPMMKYQLVTVKKNPKLNKQSTTLLKIHEISSTDSSWRNIVNYSGTV